MRQREKDLIETAIKKIHHEDDYHGGMRILASLLEVDLPDPKDDIRQIDIADMVYVERVERWLSDYHSGVCGGHMNLRQTMKEMP